MKKAMLRNIPVVPLVCLAVLVGVLWESLSFWQRAAYLTADAFALTTLLEWCVYRERRRCVAAVYAAEDVERLRDDPDWAKRDMARDAVFLILKGEEE